MPIAERCPAPQERLPPQRLRLFKLVLVLQQHPHICEGVEIAERIIEQRRRLVHRLPQQLGRLVELALVLEQPPQLVDGGESVGMTMAECLAARLERLPQQLGRLVEPALVRQQPPQIVDGGESVGVPIAECLAAHLDHLSVQRRRLVDLALSVQLVRPGEGYPMSLSGYLAEIELYAVDVHQDTYHDPLEGEAARERAAQAEREEEAEQSGTGAHDTRRRERFCLVQPLRSAAAEERELRQLLRGGREPGDRIRADDLRIRRLLQALLCRAVG